MAEADPFAPKEFAKPPEEVLRYFKAKGLKPSFHWQDVMLDEHAYAFTVAKSAGYDVLADIRAAVDKAIEERQDFEQFRQELTPILQKKGWWGRAKAIDPDTGKPMTVRLGSPARLKLIYEANIRTAYAAGEWERSWRTRRVLPYLEYLHTTALDPRPEHLAWVGTVLPVEDEWWDEHFPPNDFECQCRTRQISEAEAKTKAGFGKRPIDFGTRYEVNKRTGQVMEVPNGIGAGWNNNPGKARMKRAADLLAGRIDQMDEATRRIAAADLAGSALFRAIAKGVFPFDPHSTDPANLARGQIAAPFAALPGRLAKKLDASARTVRLSVRDAKVIAADPNDFAYLQQLLDEGAMGDDGVIRGVVAGEAMSAKLRVEDDGQSVYVEQLSRGRAREAADVAREEIESARPVVVTGKDFHRPGILLWGTSDSAEVFAETWQRVIGKKPADFFAALVKGAPAERMSVKISGAGKPGKPASIGTEMVLKNGRRRVAELNRTYAMDAEGELTVVHSFFLVRHDLQGSGIGVTMLRNAMAEYRRMGVRRVTTQANIDAGSYTWAKFGFAPERAEWLAMRQRLRFKVQNLAGLDVIGADDLKTALDVLESDDPKAIWRVSDLRGATKVRLGKGRMATVGQALLQNENWRGILDLRDEETMTRFTAYANR